MEQIRISGMEPISVIRSQIKYSKTWDVMPKLMPKELEAKTIGVITRKITALIDNLDALKTLWINQTRP